MTNYLSYYVYTFHSSHFELLSALPRKLVIIRCYLRWYESRIGGTRVHSSHAISSLRRSRLEILFESATHVLAWHALTRTRNMRQLLLKVLLAGTRVFHRCADYLLVSWILYVVWHLVYPWSQVVWRRHFSNVVERSDWYSPAFIIGLSTLRQVTGVEDIVSGRLVAICSDTTPVRIGYLWAVPSRWWLDRLQNAWPLHCIGLYRVCGGAQAWRQTLVYDRRQLVRPLRMVNHLWVVAVIIVKLLPSHWVRTAPRLYPNFPRRAGHRVIWPFRLLGHI